MDQYFALQDLYGWKRSDFASDEAWEGIREALVLQFNSYFGEDAESLGPWEDLCDLIGLKPIPKTVEDCRKASNCSRTFMHAILTRRENLRWLQV